MKFVVVKEDSSKEMKIKVVIKTCSKGATTTQVETTTPKGTTTSTAQPTTTTQGETTTSKGTTTSTAQPTTTTQGETTTPKGTTTSTAQPTTTTQGETTTTEGITTKPKVCVSFDGLSSIEYIPKEWIQEPETNSKFLRSSEKGGSFESTDDDTVGCRLIACIFLHKNFPFT